MAELTGDVQMQSAYGLRGVREPTDQGPGLAGEGLKLLGNMIGFGAEQEKNSVNNKIAQGTFDIFSQADQNLRGTTMSPQAQAASTSATDTLGKVQSAVNQGSMPLDSVDLHLQNLASGLLARYPNEAADIMDHFQKHGYDSYMFQGVKNQLAAQQGVVNTKIASDDQAYKVALDNGETGDTASLIQHGYKIQAANAALEAASKQAKAAQDAATAQHADAKSMQDESNQAVYQATSALISNVEGRLVNKLKARMEEIDGHPDREQAVLEEAPYWGQVGSMLWASIDQRTSGILTDPTLRSALKQQVTDTVKSVNDFYNSPQSVFNENKRVATFFQNQWHLDEMTTYKVMYQLKQLGIGSNMWSQMFQPNGVALPQKTIDQIGASLRGLSNEDAAQGQATLHDIAATLRGQLNIEDVPPERVKGVVVGNMNASWGNSKAILAGDNTQTTRDGFVNAYTNVATAAFKVQPVGANDMGSIKAASDVVTDPNAQRVIDMMKTSSQFKDQGNVLATASVSAAAHLVTSAARSNTPMTAGDRQAADGSALASLDYSPKSGTFEINSKMPKSGFNLRDPVFTNQVAQLRQKQAVLNNNLAVIAKRYPDDPNLPQGATPLSVRSFFATGGKSPLVNAKGQPVIQPQKAGETSDEQFKKDTSETKDFLRSMSVENILGTQTQHPESEAAVGKPVLSAGEFEPAIAQAESDNGIPRGLYHSLLLNGEKFDPSHPDKSSGVAFGPAQLEKGTASDMGVKDINNHSENINGGAKYLRYLKDKLGTWPKAVAAYNAGEKNIKDSGLGYKNPINGDTAADYIDRVFSGVVGS